MMVNDTNNDIQQIILRIISDHLLYSCSRKTLEMWRSRVNSLPGLSEVEIKNMGLRKKVLKSIRNNQSDLAFGILQRENVFDLKKEEDKGLATALAKLTFIDYIASDRVEDAIEFAKDKKKDFEKLYTLNGYEEITKDVLKEVCGDIDRDVIANRLNSFLFSKVTGRKCSLLHLPLITTTP